MKKIKYILSIILVSALVLNFLFVSSAKAADYNSYLKSAIFTSLPANQSLPTNLLNSNSTTFKLDLTLTDSYDPNKLSLMLDSCVNPIDQIDKTGFTGRNYTLYSRENTLTDLKTLLGSCGSPVEGSHLLYVKAEDGLTDPVIWQDTITADFTAPVGAFSMKNPDSKTLLKVGDKVDIAYTTIDTDVSQVTAKIYGRNLIWQNVAGNFIAQYIAQEGDADQTFLLPISDVVVYDNALNHTDYGNFNFPTTFSIDANSPLLSIASPQNSRTYSSKDLSVEYTASEYDSIEFYLDGVLLSSGNLSGLAEGAHTLKVIAQDLAGNETIAQSSFSIDSVAPAGLVNGFSGEITNNNPFELSGTTEPGASVQVQIGTNIYNTIADGSGKFSFSISDLSVGSYEIYISFIDSLGNKLRFLAGSFTVKKPAVKVAKANTISSDQADTIQVAQKVSLPKINDDGPFSPGHLSASAASDERFPINYQSWLILSIIVIFSIFLSAISYNVYSKMVTVKNLDTEPEMVSGEYIKDETVVEAIREEMASSPSEQPHVEEPPSEGPTLRW